MTEKIVSINASESAMKYFKVDEFKGYMKMSSSLELLVYF